MRHRVIGLVAVVGLVGCVAGTPAVAPSPSAAPSTGAPAIDTEGCEHLAKGPAEAVTVASSAAPDAPVVTSEHKRYDLTLRAFGGKQGGVVRFNSPAASDFVVFFGQDVPLRVTDATGQEVPVTLSKGSLQCSDIVARYAVKLDVGVYYMQVGPTDLKSASVVIEDEHGPSDEE